MKALILGLPLTGKSTFARQHANNITVDFGLSSMKDEKMLSKIQKLTARLLDLNTDIVLDTYPEYINWKELPSNVVVYVAIPEVDSLDKVVFDKTRLAKRKDRDFINLAKSKYPE